MEYDPTEFKQNPGNFQPQYFKGVDLTSEADLIKSEQSADSLIQTLSLEEKVALAIAEQKIGKGNIIVLSNIGTKEHPIGMKEYDFPTIYIETFYFPKEYSTEPIIFIRDEDLNVKLLYTLNLLPQFRNKYFEKYLPTYFMNQQSRAK
ncbi:MAG: hypothetical protein AB2L20_26905 [Mangrovibacterium sp.]